VEAFTVDERGGNGMSFCLSKLLFQNIIFIVWNIFCSQAERNYVKAINEMNGFLRKNFKFLLMLPFVLGNENENL